MRLSTHRLLIRRMIVLSSEIVNTVNDFIGPNAVGAQAEACNIF